METLDLNRPLEPRCDCERKETRIRTLSNGTKQFVPQCLRCGRAWPAVKKDSLTPVARDNCKAFDDKLRDEWDRRSSDYYRQRREYVQAVVETERAEKDSEWWIRYNAYLQTPEWIKKKRAVIRRDAICQGCLERPATTAHHITYEHVFNEFLFELKGLCQECHDRYHKKAGNDDGNTNNRRDLVGSVLP